MEKLYDPQNIRKFSDSIVAAVNIRDDERLDALLNVLKVLIGGPPGERCQSFYGTRVPADRCLAAVLSAPDVQSALVADAQECGKLVDTLSGLPYLTSQHCRALGLVLPCTPGSSDLRKRVVGRILGDKDLYKFDLETVTAALKEDSTELEMFLIALSTHETTKEQFLERSNHWIKWSALSPYIFQTVTGLLHELLKLLKCKTKVLACIKMFIELVQKSCDKGEIDFVSLYPCQVQALVGLLLMSPTAMDEGLFGFVRNEVRNKMCGLQRKDPSTALILVTHFPQWTDFL